MKNQLPDRVPNQEYRQHAFSATMLRDNSGSPDGTVTGVRGHSVPVRLGRFVSAD
jgi:hypothetical protein